VVGEFSDDWGQLDQFGGDGHRPFRADGLDLLQVLEGGGEQGRHGGEVPGQAG